MKKHRLIITLLLVTFAAQSVFSGDKIRVMAQNLQNFFYVLPVTGDENHPTSLSNYTDETGRQKKMDAIMNLYFPTDGSIQPADIYCFCEIECSDDILNFIATNFKQKTGLNYTYVQDGLTKYGSDESDILRKSGFVYNADRVKPYGPNTATGVGMIYTRFMRMQAFEELATGERFTLSMNHFKAGNADEGEPTNGQKRIDNANDLLSALPNALDPDILLMGDFNSNIDETCLQMLVNAGYQEQILRFDPNASIPGWGTSIIDHAFANSTMANQITAAYFHPGATRYSTGSWETGYSDHEPYMVEMELKASSNVKTYVKANSVQAGGQYLLVANGTGNGRKLFGAITGSYGNAPAIDVEETDGGIRLDTDTQLMTFEDAGNGQYYICYSNGKYLSNGAKSGGGYYTTFTPTTRDAAQAYKVNKRTDGRFELLNAVSNLYIYYGNPGYSYADNVWASYYNLNNSQQQTPFLYELKNTTGINTVNTYSQPTITRKVMVNGQLMIVTANGMCYNMQGMEMK